MGEEWPAWISSLLEQPPSPEARSFFLPRGIVDYPYACLCDHTALETAKTEEERTKLEKTLPCIGDPAMLCALSAETD